MSPKNPPKTPQMLEHEAAAVLMRRARRKIPEFHALEELNLVPYLDVMVNLIIFMLVTISAFLPLGILNIFPPASISGQSATMKNPEDIKKELNLSVIIAKDGFVIAGIGGAMPPIPMNAKNEYDYEMLSAKIMEIKDLYPDETKVVIAAEKDIKYDTLIKVMDTVREKGERILFYNVQLSPGTVQAATEASTGG
jgi:biopolymer transport protein TolR